MPRPLNEQVNDLMTVAVTLVLILAGIYLLMDAEELELKGFMAESSARIAGWLFTAYGLFRGYLVYRRIRSRSEE